MLLIGIEGNLIDNIVIKDNELFFTENINGQTVYRYKPCSKYRFNSDSYNQSMVFIFHPDYLGFISPSMIDDFTGTVLNNVADDTYHFTYNGLTVQVSEVDDINFTVTD